jgi:hypothetical protein
MGARLAVADDLLIPHHARLKAQWKSRVGHPRQLSITIGRMKKIIALLFVIPLLARAESSPEETCRTHLKDLAGALKAYRLLHDNKNPPKLADL